MSCDIALTASLQRQGQQNKSAANTALRSQDTEKIFSCVVEALSSSFRTLRSTAELVPVFSTQPIVLGRMERIDVEAHTLPSGVIEIDPKVMRPVINAFARQGVLDANGIDKAKDIVSLVIAHELDHRLDKILLEKKLGVPFDLPNAEGETLAQIRASRLAYELVEKSKGKLKLSDFNLASPEIELDLRNTNIILNQNGVSTLLALNSHKPEFKFVPSVLNNTATALEEYVRGQLRQEKAGSLSFQVFTESLKVITDQKKFQVVLDYYGNRLRQIQ